jgi:predicted component of type VI protein secretion system
VLRIVLVKAMGQVPSQELSADFNQTHGVIGRASSCDLHLPDPYQHISREQVRVVFEEGRYSVIACGIPQIVSLNGRELAKDQVVPVQDGDTLIVGEFELRIELVVPQQIPQASPEPFTDSPTQFWNSLGASSPAPDKASDPFGGLFEATPIASAPFAQTPVRPPMPTSPVGASAIPDDFDIWGDLNTAKADPALPLPAQGERHSNTSPGSAASGGRPGADPLGLGGVSASTPRESIDDLFGLKASGAGSSNDPLGINVSRHQAAADNAQELGQLGALLNNPKPYTDAPLSDKAPEIHGTFNLPELQRPVAPPAAPPVLPASPPREAQKGSGFRSWQDSGPAQAPGQTPSKVGAPASPAAPGARPPVLAPRVVEEIAAQVASEHPYVFEETPQDPGNRVD